MARAAVLGRLTWQVGTVVGVRAETPWARTIVLDVPGWPGHLAGQHVDVRLTAADGYQAQRSYSIASAADGSRVELTVELVPDGEVSSYLVRVLSVGDPLELRGPVGGWFVWRPSTVESDAAQSDAAQSDAAQSDAVDPVLLVAGGSGMVPLMAMIRTRARAGSRAPFRLLYSVREPAMALYADELAAQDEVAVRYLYTRRAPKGYGRPIGRIGLLDLAAGFPAAAQAAVYVCGPTGFVEAAADLLTTAGHDARRIRTERFGPSGGPT
jgi:ferredoxin-NADP reductase